jgi:hypothetical protein
MKKGVGDHRNPEFNTTPLPTAPEAREDPRVRKPQLLADDPQILLAPG